MDYVEFIQNKANLLRLHSLRSTAKAKSGHPTSCLSCAEIVATLYFKIMRFDPSKIDYLDNDEFILSKGHAAPVLYAALAEAGVIPKEKIMTLRELSSELEGHPVPRVKGIRVATGSLGQGLSIGLGMAYAKRLLGIDRRVYVLLGDGEMAEGSVWESINYAGKLGLSNITAILDMNRLGQSGPTMYEWNSKEYAERIQSFGWNVSTCDGHDVQDLIEKLEESKRSDKPSFIIAKTVKGKGVKFLENVEGRHGTPLSQEELEKAEKEITPMIWEAEMQPENHIKANMQVEKRIQVFPVQANYQIGDMVATREAFGKALVKLGELNSRMIVLDGDVKNSTFTTYFFEKFPERSLQCYIAEQNMIGIAVGLQTHGFDVFLSTFACFLTRAFDQIRMASYSRANLKIVGSHAGVSIGEDGPSQMGLEDLAMFRSIINSIVLYPCDAVSTEKLTGLMTSHDGISYLRTTRPKTPVIYSNDEEFRIGGSKVLRQSKKDKATIVAAGITVHEALKAYEKLRAEGLNVRVIDCYSIKPLDRENLRKAFEETRHVITVEDHYPEGGLGEAVASAGVMPHILAVRKMPHSGKPQELLAEQGIDCDGIVRAVKEILE
ncbi:MAG: transketolase [Nitrososphaerota archaeon]|nr:transketolase [Candidatus Bathyarchaeota archaeon]MDW8048991.1 transketolase [Nitrososphaerota archaeon]